VALSAALSGLLAATPLSARSPFECLFASPNATAHTGDCASDVLHLANQQVVRAAVAATGLSVSQVEFVACEDASFFTAPPTRLPDGTRGFRIIYPARLEGTADQYAAAIVHELGHVMQLQGDGSVDAVRARHPICGYIELEADYLAGIIFRRNIAEIDRGQFERNLRLVGNYDPKCPDHGTPEERTAAFRTGFYLAKPPADLQEARREFADHHFASIIRFKPA
jgi:hypothetical protein